MSRYVLAILWYPVHKEHSKTLFSDLNKILKRAGGLHQDFLEIDFLVDSDRGE